MIHVLGGECLEHIVSMRPSFGLRAHIKASPTAAEGLQIPTTLLSPSEGLFPWETTRLSLPLLAPAVTYGIPADVGLTLVLVVPQSGL